MSDEVQAGPVVKVARDLREILNLSGNLREQAIHHARSRLMPGAEATVALGNVGSPSEWAEQVGAEELYHLTVCPKRDHSHCKYAERADDEDEADEPPLQTLLFWSEAWRAEHGYALDKRPTLETEVAFLRGSLSWAWANELHWTDFAADVRRARTKLENILLAGERSQRGSPCMYEACKGRRLVRKLEPYRNEDGEKAWRWGNWHCPRCHREWTESQYAAMVTAAAEAAKSETIGGDEWVAPELAARRTGRPAATIRQWVMKGYLSRVCIIEGRRVGFVRMADVRERHEASGRRKRAA